VHEGQIILLLEMMEAFMSVMTKVTIGYTIIIFLLENFMTSLLITKVHIIFLAEFKITPLFTDPLKNGMHLVLISGNISG